MDSGKKLIIWIAAYFENANQYYGWSSSPTQILIDHFNARGVPLGDASIAWIVSSLGDPSKGSLVINDGVETLEAKLIESKIFTDPADVNSTSLAAEQWAKGDLLDSNATNLKNFTYVGSMMNLGMSFVSIPEAAYNEECPLSITREQALGLLNQTDVANNNRTLLNPLNVKALYEMEAMGDSQTNDILARFGLLTIDQIECLINYIDNLNESSSLAQALGTLTQRGIQMSFDNVKEVLPMQLASRYLATFNFEANKTCETYVS